jgi:hypothetical protein
MIKYTCQYSQQQPAVDARIRRLARQECQLVARKRRGLWYFADEVSASYSGLPPVFSEHGLNDDEALATLLREAEFLASLEKEALATG